MTPKKKITKKPSSKPRSGNKTRTNSGARKNTKSAKKSHSSRGKSKNDRRPRKQARASRPLKPNAASRSSLTSAKRTSKKSFKITKAKKDVIRVIPLGGVEQIGANMTAVEMNDQIIVIDSGFGFSNEEQPGIDYVIPNTAYLEENKHKVKAVVITHGHLDHIGGIPYLINKIGNPPIYTREFGALLIKKKAEEFPGLKLNVKTVEKDDGAIKLSEDFKVTFFGLTHSIPDSTGVIIETKFGDIVSTGDVRVDNFDGVPTALEYEQYELFKKRNVLLMTMDSTGIPYPGWSASETQVMDVLDRFIKEATGRLIIGTFASQVERLISFLESAKKYGKYVVIDGRSMVTNLGIAKELKLGNFDHVIPIDQMDDYPPHKIVMLVTGSQGEEFASLMRMSNKTHKHVKLGPTDTIVLSSSVVPGNDFSVDKLKDNLYRTDAKIITHMDNIVHASGHGKRDELAWVHNQIDYKYFMPIHGHHFRLKMHKELAVELGAKPEDVVVPENGSIVEISDKGNKIEVLKEKVPGELLIIDGLSISAEQHLVIRDRQILAQDGIFMVVIMIDKKTKKLRKSPYLISRGFVVLKDNQELLGQARQMIKETVEEAAKNMNPIDFDYIKDSVSRKLVKFLLQSTAKRPVVIPVILSA